MINIEAATFERETILARTRPLTCNESDRKQVLRALADFDHLCEVREQARGVRTVVAAEDELVRLGVNIPPALKKAALVEFRERACGELSEWLWAYAVGKLEEDAGPVVAAAHRRMAAKLRKSAQQVHDKVAEVVGPFGLEPGTGSVERELIAAAMWHESVAERGLRLDGQSFPRKCLSENFAEAL